MKFYDISIQSTLVQPRLKILVGLLSLWSHKIIFLVEDGAWLDLEIIMLQSKHDYPQALINGAKVFEGFQLILDMK